MYTKTYTKNVDSGKAVKGAEQSLKQWKQRMLLKMDKLKVLGQSII